MQKISVVLIVIIIICFVLGAWPVSIAALGALLYTSKSQQLEKPDNKRTVEELEKENEALRAELADQAVRRAMEKAESREKN